MTAFVHVVDCRAGEAEGTEADGADCSGPARRQSLHPVLDLLRRLRDPARRPDRRRRGLPSRRLGGGADPHRAGRQVDERASSHNGYNYARSVANWGSDAGLDLVKEAAEALGARERNGWGPETGIVLVSGGSHAGNAAGIPHVDHFTPGRRVHLIPLEPIAAADTSTFAINPPWRKKVWRDPEAEGTD